MYKLIWQQDFLKSGADLSDWNKRLGNDIVDDDGNVIVEGWGNGERQFYTGHEENVYIDGNGLHLRARRETTTIQDGRSFAYTSARIDTKDHMSFTYGKLIVRAKLPTGNGIWPAIWLMPQESAYGPWPASGEIDILEAKGRLPQHIFGTLHYGKDWENKKINEFSYRFENGSIEEFHDYGLEWDAESIKWLVDGHVFAERRLEPGVMPFDKSFYLILNLAVGGWFDNVPVNEEALPAVMTVTGIWLYQ
ncbi:glycoside hydrolase family 16 protein [Paenibacillus sp. LHD-117]|uniref:glycoside hydrolase family 16 protein n=1 Tax=Paenibacillus sp. LHD-117 TaxID=3071412 RepID=UPI0027E20A30|nr:glycoside hydrolase family 16 protein [Paenibacillus sp. LHD-117]MDQ6417822.1 glycoside hydrolase family 16 protein [Paenibacillus sp. LHD-117]